MFKQAVKKNLMFNTPKGSLNILQVATLKESDLIATIKQYHTEIKKSNFSELDFLEETVSVDEDLTLRFNILKDLYNDIKSERQHLKENQAVKEHNKAILELIAKKKQEDLANKSIEELEKMLK